MLDLQPTWVENIYASVPTSTNSAGNLSQNLQKAVIDMYICFFY